MVKHKLKEIMKVATASVLSIGMFSMAFMGVNSAAFAAATDGTKNIPAAVEAVSIPENIPPANFQSPALTVIELESQFIVSPYALSANDAAELGAQYIWEVFGKSIDGMAVEMFYSDWDNTTRAYWGGMVFDCAEELTQMRAELDEWQKLLKNAVDSNGAIPADSPVWDKMPTMVNPVFHFMIDAVSGERIDISRFVHIEMTEEKREAFINWRILAATGAIEYQPYEIIPDKKHVLAAKKYAERHFNNSTVVDVELIRTMVSRGADNDGNTFIIDRNLIFSATDDTGRVAEVVISVDSKKLLSISTQNNDFVPHITDEVKRFRGTSGTVRMMYVNPGDESSGTYIREHVTIAR